MHSIARAKAPAGIFIGLIVASLGLKAALGPEVTAASHPRPGTLEQQLADRLRLQGFSTRLQVTTWQSPAILATRGNCRLIVRDARDGRSDMHVYAHDAAGIGEVRYLLAGRDYRLPPTFPMFVAKIRGKILRRLSLDGTVSIPLALATTPACGGSDFGLADTRAAA